MFVPSNYFQNLLASQVVKSYPVKGAWFLFYNALACQCVPVVAMKYLVEKTALNLESEVLF